MIFVDTSFWVAFRNRRDQHHETALALMDRYAAAPLLTSNHVCGETWTYLRRRMGHDAAVNFLTTMDHSFRIQVVHVNPALEDESLQWLRRRDDREYSFVDATSFSLMRYFGLHEAFAFDQDFSAAGFVPLRL